MSLVDAETGEVVERYPAPVIASPSTPLTAIDIANQCRSVEVWASVCESIDELRDADNRLAAIAEYVKRTSTEGRAKVEAARRRLEQRIGMLLGPATPNGKGESGSLASDPSDLTPNERSQMRKLNDHPDIVDAVINDSTDETPASRRRVLDEINRAKHKPPAEPDAEMIHARELVAVAKAIQKAGEFFIEWTPEQVHALNDPTTADSVMYLMKVVAPWWETYKATKPTGLVVHDGGKQ